MSLNNGKKIHILCYNNYSEKSQTLQIHDQGIHIPSCPVVPDDYNLVQTIKIALKVAFWMSEVLLNYKIFSKILV